MMMRARDSNLMTSKRRVGKGAARAVPTRKTCGDGIGDISSDAGDGA
jgi:hypothetical protein